MKTERWRKFLESLEGEKSWELLTLGEDRWQEGDMMKYPNTGFLPVPKKWFGKIADATIFESGKRPVQIPDLKEKVKAFGRDAMNAAAQNTRADLKRYIAFRALCEPEKDNKKETG